MTRMNKTESPICEAVIHHGTGRLNGWFHLPGMASDVARFFREEFPEEKFSVIKLRDPRPGENLGIHDGTWLDAIKPPIMQGFSFNYPEILCGRFVFSADIDPEALPRILVTRHGKSWSVSICDPLRYRMHIDGILRNTREYIMCPNLRARWPVWEQMVSRQSKMVLMGMTGIYHAPEAIAREAVEIIAGAFPSAVVKWPKGVQP